MARRDKLIAFARAKADAERGWAKRFRLDVIHPADVEECERRAKTCEADAEMFDAIVTELGGVPPPAPSRKDAT